MKKLLTIAVLVGLALSRGPLAQSIPGDVVADFGDVRQRMDGFGAADPWVGALTDAQADLFFSSTSGIGLSMLRVGIDTNGNKISAYSNATKAAARGAVVWAYPFSAPGAWKDNGTTNNGGHLLPAYYDAWATRLAGFAATLQKNAGVPLYGLSVQNEPDWTDAWDTMLYTNQEMVNFVKVLGPKVAALNPRPKLMLPEVGGWGNAWGYTSAVLGDSIAAPYLDIVTAHNYGGVSAPQITGKPIWQTEASSFEGFDPGIGNGIMVARWIHDAIVTGNVSAWHYWWLIGQNADNEGLIGYNGNTQITKRLYTLGNFSKFIRPGFVRVETSGAPFGISASAYKNPATNAFVVVAINESGSSVPFGVALNGITAATMTPWVTSATENLQAHASIAVSGGRFSMTLPPSTVTTFVSNGGIPPPSDTIAPSAPTNVAGTATGAGQITLTWTASTDNVGVTGYKVLRNGVQIATTATPGYVDNGLALATLYTYTVAAVDAAGNVSVPSVPLPVVTIGDIIAPSAPTGLSATAVSPSQVQLTWTASTDNVGVTGYRVYRNGGQVGVTGSTSYSDTGLSASTTYTYTVSADDAAANVSVPSTSASATTPATPTSTSTPFGGVPAAIPGIVQAENFDDGGPQVAFQDWTPGNTGGTYRATDVDIESAADAGGGYNVGWMVPGEWLRYSVNVATAGSYTVEARVASDGPGGTFHLEVNGSPITGSLVVPNTGGWQNWQWVTVSGVPFATGLQTLRVVLDGAPGSFFGNLNYFRFTTVSALGDTTAPSTPTGLSATAVSPSQVNLSWTASTDNVGVAGYRIYRNGVQIGVASATSYSDTGLAGSTTYGYTVAAVDAAGNVSALSLSASATTPTAPDTIAPSTPTNLSATPVSSAQINLSWTASTDNVGVTGYRIHRNGVQIGVASATGYSDTGLAGSTTYGYTVAAVDAAGNASAPSPSASATTPGPSGPPPPAFVQVSADASPSASSSLSVSFSSSTVAGNVIIVGLAFKDTMFGSIVDSRGNTFTQVGSELVTQTGHKSRVYYAQNIVGGMDTVTVTLQGNSSFIEAYVTEYAGISTVSPIDAQAGNSGPAGAVTSGSATTTVAGDIIYGYCSAEWACTAGPGFTARSTFHNNLVEDLVAGAPGSYAATGFANNGWSMHMVALRPATTPAISIGSPYGGVPAAIPGIVEAENFDDGGPEAAFHDSTPGNAGGAYRATDVDIEPAADAGGGYNVGWMVPGEWLTYSVNVAMAGSYTVEARVASDGPGGTFHLEVNGSPVTGSLVVPNTGGWQNWQWVTVSGVPLAAGPQTLRVVLDGAPGAYFGNINYFRLTNESALQADPGTSLMSTSSTIEPTAENTSASAPLLTANDYDGDAKADLAAYQPLTGEWQILQSRANYGARSITRWGTGTDVPMPGDYDGDRKTDVAYYRPSTGTWSILKSSTDDTTSFDVLLGANGDIPVPADYDGDRITDVAVYSPSTGLWRILNSITGYATEIVSQWGSVSDVPVPGDYDGDGKTDPAVYRPSTGEWRILQSSTDYSTNITIVLGSSTDILVPADYDGDGVTDVAIYQPATGQWQILLSSSGFKTNFVAMLGASGDVPVPADYDGDGRADLAVVHSATWQILYSRVSYASGITVSSARDTDIPLPRRP